MFVPISLSIFDFLLLPICHFLDVFLNPAIIFLAVGEGILCCKSFAMLGKYSKKTEALDTKNKSADVSRKTGSLDISERIVSERVLSWGDFIELKNDYVKDRRIYDIFSSLIQIFTLLGILGTVAGLYLSLNDVVAEGQTFSYEGIGFALSSTIWGITFALVFKAIDSIGTAPKADDIEARMDTFEKDYEIRAAIVAEKAEKQEQEQASEAPQPAASNKAPAAAAAAGAAPSGGKK